MRMPAWLASALVSLALALGLMGCGGQRPPIDPARVELSFEGGPQPSGVVVSGLPNDVLDDLALAEEDELKGILSVFTNSADVESHSQPALLGSWLVTPRRLEFRPRFPWAEGVSYEARLDLEALARDRGLEGLGPRLLTAEYQQPHVTRTPTEVEGVFPSSREVPANLLKFYIKFSAAMRTGATYRYLRLVDLHSGEAVESPFLELEQELWDPSGTRLTLFLHPGRIKRGLRPNAEEGPALSAGGHYRLEIDADWRDRYGQPLATGWQHEFRVLAADRQQPSLDSWSLTEPAAGSREALEISFGEALDHGLLQDALAILGPGGGGLAGVVEITDQEQRWRFVPDQPWQRGRYTLEVSSRLEDLAGNTLQRLFDVDLQGGPQPNSETDSKERSFRIE